MPDWLVVLLGILPIGAVLGFLFKFYLSMRGKVMVWRNSRLLKRELPRSLTNIQPSADTLATIPVGLTKSSAEIAVRVESRNGDKLNGVRVTFITDNGRFENGAPTIDGFTGGHPSGTVEAASRAGTAIANLDCRQVIAFPGVSTVYAVIQLPDNTSLVLRTRLTVIGPAAATGLTLTLTPDSLLPGEILVASVTAVDSNGSPVCDGTLVFFTEDIPTLQKGIHNSDHSVTLMHGQGATLITTDATKPGLHSLAAYTVLPDINGILRPAVLIARQFDTRVPPLPTDHPPA